MNFIGIDWADETHDICIVSETSKVMSEFKIKHNMDGFHHLKGVIDNLGDVGIVIERPNGLLVDFMVEQGWNIYIVAPRATAAKRGHRSKNDKRDALLLATLLRTGDRECRPLSRPSVLSLRIKGKIRLYDQLLADRRRYSNRLIHVLKLYYPVMTHLFSKIHKGITLEFLKRFPDPQTAREASLQDLTDFFTEQRYRFKSKIPTHFEKLQAPSPEATDVEGHRRTMLYLVILLETVNAQVLPLEKEIMALVKQHPEAEWWSHFPGVGPFTSARLLAYIGDNRDRFPNHQSLQATAGTVPITQQSGKRNRVLFRNECSKPLRRAVTDWSRHSLMRSAWAKAYYNQQIARGHSKERAYRALANRWLRVFWTLWQTGDFYNEQVHQSHSELFKKQSKKLIELAS